MIGHPSVLPEVLPALEVGTFVQYLRLGLWDDFLQLIDLILICHHGTMTGSYGSYPMLPQLFGGLDGMPC